MTMSIAPENIPALIAMELRDARFHQQRAAYWTDMIDTLPARSQRAYRDEIAYHIDRMNHHYATAIGWAGR